MSLPVPLIVIVTIAIFILVFYLLRINNRNYTLRTKIRDIVHQRNEIENFLNLFSQSLERVEILQDSMNTTARYVADLVEAESICIFEVENEELVASGLCGLFPLSDAGNYLATKPRFILEYLRRNPIPFGNGLLGRAAVEREPLLIEDSQDPRIAEIHTLAAVDSLMIMPMIKNSELTGLICAVNNRMGASPFTREQFNRLKFISSQVLLAQDLVRVYANLSRQQRITQELEFARNLQASLLPNEFPEWGDFSFYGYSRSSKEVGGDFYDFVQIDDDRLLVVIGDACGKGIPACMLMAMTRSFIRSATEHFTTLEDLLLEVGRNIYRDTDEENFITLACCVVNRRANLVEYARAGHTELLTYVRKHVRKIYPKGTALGLLPSEFNSYDSFCMSSAHQMSFLLFTDGINEVINAASEEFGLERLKEVFERAGRDNMTPEETCKLIMKEVDAFSGGGEFQFDDQTMVIIQRS
jgi:serine phosphatase RsbU (regulator of sigma subunit)/putative methionine-R-sulfoxide reductase with GAF domain